MSMNAAVSFASSGTKTGVWVSGLDRMPRKLLRDVQWNLRFHWRLLTALTGVFLLH